MTKQLFKCILYIYSWGSFWLKTKDIQSYPWVSAAHGFGPSQAPSVAKLQALAVRQLEDILTYSTATLQLTKSHIRPIKGNKKWKQKLRCHSLAVDSWAHRVLLVSRITSSPHPAISRSSEQTVSLTPPFPAQTPPSFAVAPPLYGYTPPPRFGLFFPGLDILIAESDFLVLDCPASLCIHGINNLDQSQKNLYNQY